MDTCAQEIGKKIGTLANAADEMQCSDSTSPRTKTRDRGRLFTFTLNADEQHPL